MSQSALELAPARHHPVLRRSRFMLSLMREHVWSYLAGSVLLAATLWMTLAVPRFLQQAIEILEQDPDPAGAGFLNRIGWILFFALATIVTRTGSRLCFFVPGRRVEFDLKNRLLAHLTTLQRVFFIANPSGAIISRINNDINGVRMMLGFGLMGLFNSVGTLSLAPYYMYQLSPKLTLYCALPVLAAFAILQVGVRRLRRWQLYQMKSMQDLSDFTVESYNGIDVLKTYRGYGWAERRFGGLSGQVRDAAIRMSNVRAFLMPLLTHIASGLKVLLVLVGGMLVITSEMTMGGFMAYALYLSMLVPPLMGMTFMMFILQRGMTSLVSMVEIFDTQPGLPATDPKAEAALPAQLEQGLRVQDLTYAYPDDPEHPVLHGIHFTVRPGEIVGLFGAMGSGKTTLINCLNRYLTPPQGTVFLDGIDTTRLSQATVRAHLVTVTQEPFLFSDTIRENVAFGGEPLDEPLSADELEGAAHRAALQPDLAQLPNGMTTLVGEKGITLSGGQKQRISLARSLLKPSDVLVLDDVLSAVDHETERFLIKQIYGLKNARATLIVSHRTSALERAHRILVLQEGRLVAQGTHAELCESEGPYRQAWLLQREQAPAGAANGESAAHAGERPS